MSGNLTPDAQAEGTRAGLWHEFGCCILCKVPALKCLPDTRPTWYLTEVWPDRSPHAETQASSLGTISTKSYS
jgi:hypothetical protein